jgi:hypothetical protein
VGWLAEERLEMLREVEEGEVVGARAVGRESESEREREEPSKP